MLNALILNKPHVTLLTITIWNGGKEMKKKGNMGIWELKGELERLNPNIDFCVYADTYPGIIIAKCSDCAQLNLPKGYYLNEKNGLTNKHNTASGQNESFDLMTLHEYLAMLD